MELPNQTKKYLQGLMMDARWTAVELALQEYLKENFLQDSGKKDTEFNTIWYLASMEGAKFHLQRFINELELQARNAK